MYAKSISKPANFNHRIVPNKARFSNEGKEKSTEQGDKLEIARYIDANYSVNRDSIPEIPFRVTVRVQGMFD